MNKRINSYFIKYLIFDQTRPQTTTESVEVDDNMTAHEIYIAIKNQILSSLIEVKKSSEIYIDSISLIDIKYIRDKKR